LNGPDGLRPPSLALLLAAHGERGGSAGNARLKRLAEALAAGGIASEVRFVRWWQRALSFTRYLLLMDISAAFVCLVCWTNRGLENASRMFLRHSGLIRD
jgi:hypothetical protein